eukprot:4587314-Pyramimonas_sp.AAC.1
MPPLGGRRPSWRGPVLGLGSVCKRSPEIRRRDTMRHPRDPRLELGRACPPTGGSWTKHKKYPKTGVQRYSE